LLSAQTIDEGVSLLKQNKFDEAKAIFERIISANDTNAAAQFYLGQIYYHHAYTGRDIDAAVDHLESAAESNPRIAEYQFMYGAALGEKVRQAGVLKQIFLAPKVKKAFLSALAIDSQFVAARIGLAQYYLLAPSIAGGNEKEGWKQIDEAVRLDELQGRLMKARMLDRAKRMEDAKKEYDTLVLSKPREWRVWKNYGFFSLRHDSGSKAEEYFQHYIELRPDTADCYQNLAQVFLKQGTVDRAVPLLEKALSIDRNFVPAILSLGDVYKTKGQKKEAKETYERALTAARFDWQKKEAEQKLKEL
jgi:tetratricopeptide (TPR) repeat protein